MGGKRGVRPSCKVEGCEKRNNAQGLCTNHYDQARKAGTIQRLTDLERFWRQVEKTDTCWLWTGAVSGSPEWGVYGYFGFNGVRMRAHRYSWELVNGSMPTDLFACHTCDTPLCVNPDHIYAGTPRQNNLDQYARSRRKQRTECRHGHPYDDPDTYPGRRFCRTCNTDAQRERRARRRLGDAA